MSTESRLQATIRTYLKDKGCYVLKTRPDARGGAPVGCPDIFFFLEGFWGAIEVKDSPEARYQPLQEVTLLRLNNWSWAKRVDPTNWLEVRAELENIL